MTSSERDEVPRRVASSGPRRAWAGAALVALVLISAAVALAVESTASSNTPGAKGVLWAADGETGDLSQWTGDGGGGPFVTGSGRVEIDSEIARSGRHSVRLSISGADGTTGSQAARLFRWRVADGSPLPEEAYYSAWYRFPHAWRPARFWNVFQWKTKISEERNDPTFVLNVQPLPQGGMRLSLFDGFRQETRDVSPVELPTGRWVHVEARYRWSSEAAGRVTVWQDGLPILGADGVQTEYPSDDPNARQWSLDNYTDGIEPADAAIFIDDAAISTVRAEPSGGSPDRAAMPLGAPPSAVSHPPSGGCARVP